MYFIQKLLGHKNIKTTEVFTLKLQTAALKILKVRLMICRCNAVG